MEEFVGEGSFIERTLSKPRCLKCYLELDFFSTLVRLVLFFFSINRYITVL